MIFEKLQFIAGAFFYNKKEYFSNFRNKVEKKVLVIGEIILYNTIYFVILTLV